MFSKNTRASFFLTALLVVSLGALHGCGKPAPRYEAIPAGSTVVVLGDSLAVGVGASPNESYPTHLARLSGWRVINAGVSGDTTQGGRERLPDLMDEHRPKLVIIELGGNDFLRRAPESQVRTNLNAMIQLVKSHGAEAVLVAIPRPSMTGAATGFLKDASLYEELAEAQNVLLVPKIISRLMGDDSMKSDPIHLNAEGYRHLAEELSRSLKDSGYLKA
jgi:acyl-CoA thioesterase I